jgi:hypothetical protein
MSTNPFPDGARASLGSPTLPVNAPGTYLRHRAATERAYRQRKKKLRTRRLIVLAIAVVLYFAIGRDLIQLAFAGSSLFTARARGDAQGAATAAKGVFRPEVSLDALPSTVAGEPADSYSSTLAAPAASGQP